MKNAMKNPGEAQSRRGNENALQTATVIENDRATQAPRDIELLADPGPIALPCTSYDADPWREKRLRLVAAFALGRVWRALQNPRTGAHPQCTFNRRIARLHDHKGTLFVTYRGELHFGIAQALRDGWEQIGNEPRENVIFELED
jgi:hypothetical protein